MKQWLRSYLIIIVGFVCAIVCIAATVQTVLFSDVKIEELEFADIDFEWVDDFGNYEVVIVHEEKPHYLRVPNGRVKLIYANEDFLNFVIVDHSQRIIDRENHYSVNVFYININYEEY